MRTNWHALFLVLWIASLPTGGYAKKKDDSLSNYMQRITRSPEHRTSTTAPGSLWQDGGPYVDMAADSTAHRPGDLVTVKIVEQTLAESSGSISSERSFETGSGITGLAGKLSTAGVNPIAAAHSNSQLKGQAQTATSSSLRASVGGRIVAVMSNGNLVIEARRSVLINNEKQFILLRGVARPWDISAGNVVLSNQLSDLELELRGKGAVSEATRQPNWIIRTLLKVLTF